ncbi:MAG TPA: hydrolase [Crocinitomicaceae bacterium]|nr:hydrolase [Crocinitomicaceae bacterium]
MNSKKLTIAVDFDGTLVEEKYPEIGKEKEDAFEVLIRLHNDGHRLLLWTYRHGRTLREAIEFCKQKGVEFYAINKNFPEEEYDTSVPRKLLADIYIDDRNIGGMLEWEEIYRLITNKMLDKKAKQQKKSKFFPW